MRYGVSTILIKVFVAAFLVSTPISRLPAQEPCEVEVKWFGPDIGDSKIVRPDALIGAWRYTQQGGDAVFYSNSITVTLRGRTGERSFELEVRETTLRSLKDDEEKIDIRAYYLSPFDTLSLRGIRFQAVELIGSSLKVVILGHPEPEKKACRAPLPQMELTQLDSAMAAAPPKSERAIGK